MRFWACVVLASAFQVNAVQAEEWTVLPGQTSASFAKAGGWLLADTTAMSWPDGRQALVTFWQRCYTEGAEICFTQRCIDYFDADMLPTGGDCYAAH